MYLWTKQRIYEILTYLVHGQVVWITLIKKKVWQSLYTFQSAFCNEKILYASIYSKYFWTVHLYINNTHSSLCFYFVHFGIFKDCCSIHMLWSHLLYMPDTCFFKGNAWPQYFDYSLHKMLTRFSDSVEKEQSKIYLIIMIVFGLLST